MYPGPASTGNAWIRAAQVDQGFGTWASKYPKVGNMYIVYTLGRKVGILYTPASLWDSRRGHP